MTDNKKGKWESVKGASSNFPVADYAEVLLDACIESEVLKGIPVLSTGIATIKTYLQFREGKFKKKVQAFVEAAGSFTSEEWTVFADSLQKESKKQNFIDELLEIIDRAESEQKAKILGGVFRRLVKEEIAYAVFEDQVRITNDMLVINIHTFTHCYHNEYVLEDSIGDILVSYRLAKRKIEMATRTVSMLAGTKEQYIKTTYDITNIGFLYLETLHQVYKEQIDPHVLYTGEIVTD